MRAWTITAAPSRSPSARSSAVSRERAIAGGGGTRGRLRADQRAEPPGARAPAARAPPPFAWGGGAERDASEHGDAAEQLRGRDRLAEADPADRDADERLEVEERARDRKSTRLNSSHLVISYAVFFLQKTDQ